MLTFFKHCYYFLIFCLEMRKEKPSFDKMDTIIFGDLKTADKKLGRVRNPDGSMSYLPRRSRR